MHQPTSSYFFFNDTATTEIYTLSLHDALPILERMIAPGVSSTISSTPVAVSSARMLRPSRPMIRPLRSSLGKSTTERSEEHTSLQSRQYLVCRLLLEKKHTKSRILSYHLSKPL